MDDQLAALEARVVEDPDDLDGWLVLADLLQKRGDPHGELIALQIAADRKPATRSKTPAQLAFRKAFAKHAPALIKPLVKLGASTKDPTAEPLVWRTGFIRRATIENPPYERRLKRPPLPTMLATLLAHPSARFLTELSIRTDRPKEATAALAELFARSPRALQELELIARTHLDGVPAIWKTLPRLRRITLAADRFELEGLELPEARRVSFLTRLFTPRSMAAVAAAPWPHVERLELRLGTGGGRETLAGPSAALGTELLENRQTEATFEDLAPLFRRTDLTALTHLRIRKAPFAGGVLRAVVEAPFSAQLQVLDLSGGTLTPQDIKFAAQRKAVLANLRELWVPAITQWSGVAADLATLAKHVVTKPPFDLLDGRNEIDGLPGPGDRLQVIRE